MHTREQVVARAADAAFGKALVTNVHRSLITEVIVAAALEPEWTWCAADYASYDFQHASGVRLEVKQSAALQTWNAASKLKSKASFDIAPRKGEWVDGITWKAGEGRNADIFVFAYHPVADLTADHREPSQWVFYIVLEAALPKTKSIRLPALNELGSAVPFVALRDSVNAAVRTFQSRTPGAV
jgi:hypothetical protein